MEFDAFDMTAMARALVDVGFREAAVKAVLAQEFPGLDVDAAYDEALFHMVARAVERSALRRREELAAIASEHDLGRSLHDLSDSRR